MIKRDWFRNLSGEAKRTQVRAALLASNVGVAVLIVASVAFVTGTSRRAYEAQARETAEGLAAIAQSNLASELSAVDVLMRAALNELEAMGESDRLSDATIAQVLDRHRRLLPGVEGLRLVDADGLVRWGSDVRELGVVDISDQEHFQRARVHRGASAALTGPLKSRFTGHWVVTLSHPRSVHGRFAGMLYAAVPLDHFQRLFGRYELGSEDAITLRAPDLRLLARRASGVNAPVSIGSTTMSARLREAITANPLRGVVVSRVAFDGIERTTAYRRVEGWPLIVLAGLASDRFFAPWRAQRLQIALSALGAWLLVAGTSVIAYLAWNAEWRGVRALAKQTRLMEALMRTTADGIHIIDHEGKVVAANDAFARMLGTSQVVGRSVGSWDVHNDEARVRKWLETARDGDRQRIEVQHRRDDGAILDVDLQLSVATIEDEPFVFASARDITENKKLRASLEDTAARVRDLYDNAPCGYHSLDADGVFVHANARMLAWLGCSADEVIGRARLVDFLDEEGRAAFAVNFARMKRDGHLDGVEFRLVPSRGEIRYLSASVTAIVDASGRYLMSRAVTLDVTAQREARLEMARVMREQNAMLDNDIVAMVKLRERTAIWKNRALDHMFGYAPGELDGRLVRLLYPDEDSFEALGAEAYPVLAAGRHFRTQLQLRHKDGHLLWVDLSGVSLGAGLSLWMMVDITALKRSQAQMEHIAFHDALTGLPNRLLLADRMAQAIIACQRHETLAAVCYLDLDGFKQVNDLHGHDAGDALLVEIGRRLQAGLRGNDTAARLGGDEFVVLLPALADADEWRAIVERLVEELQTPIALPGGARVTVGTSVGVALAPSDGVDPSALLGRADRAMLRAKRLGKGRIERVGADEA